MAEYYNTGGKSKFLSSTQGAVGPDIHYLNMMGCEIDAQANKLRPDGQDIEYLEDVLRDNNCHMEAQMKLKMRVTELEQELQTKQSSHEEELRWMTEFITDLQGEVSQLKDQLRDKDRTISKLQQEKQSLSSNLHFYYTALANKTSQHYQNLCSWGIEKRDLMQRLRKVAEERQMPQSAMKLLQAEKEELKREELQFEKDDFLAKIKELRIQKEEFQREKDELRFDKDEFQAKFEELQFAKEDFLAKIKELQIQKEEFQREKDDLRFDKDEFLAKIEELRIQKEEFRREENELLFDKNEFLAKMDELRIQKEEFQREKDELRFDKNEFQAKIEELRIQKEEFQHEKDELWFEKEELLGKRKEFLTEKEELRFEKDALLANIEEIQIQKEEFQHEKGELLAEKEELRFEKEEFQREKILLQEANEVLKNEIEAKRRKKKGFWGLFCWKSRSREKKEKEKGVRQAAEDAKKVPVEEVRKLETCGKTLDKSRTSPEGTIEADNTAAEKVLEGDQASLKTKCGDAAELQGKESLIKCHFNDTAVTALLDSGTQVSVMSRKWKNTNMPDLAIRPLSEYGDKFSEKKVKLVSSELISSEGWSSVTVHNLPGAEGQSIIVPFLILDMSLENPLIGTNLLGKLVEGHPKGLLPTIDSLLSTATCLSSEKAADRRAKLDGARERELAAGD